MMGYNKSKLGKSINVALYLNSIPLGGQQNASLIQRADALDITNKIDGEWTENLMGKKGWNIQCSGLYVINDKSFELLEDAFMKNKPLTVQINIGNKKYSGSVLIIDFPLSAVFNKEFKYNISLLGTGPLKEV